MTPEEREERKERDQFRREARARDGWRECWGLVDSNGAWLVLRSREDTDMRVPPFGPGWKRMVFWQTKPAKSPFDFLKPRRFWKRKKRKPSLRLPLLEGRVQVLLDLRLFDDGTATLGHIQVTRSK